MYDIDGWKSKNEQTFFYAYKINKFDTNLNFKHQPKKTLEIKFKLTRTLDTIL